MTASSAALDLVVTATGPGALVDLPGAWPEPFERFTGAATPEAIARQKKK